MLAEPHRQPLVGVEPQAVPGCRARLGVQPVADRALPAAARRLHQRRERHLPVGADVVGDRPQVDLAALGPEQLGEDGGAAGVLRDLRHQEADQPCADDEVGALPCGGQQPVAVVGHLGRDRQGPAAGLADRPQVQQGDQGPVVGRGRLGRGRPGRLLADHPHGVVRGHVQLVEHLGVGDVPLVEGHFETGETGRGLGGRPVGRRVREGDDVQGGPGVHELVELPHDERGAPVPAQEQQAFGEGGRGAGGDDRVLVDPGARPDFAGDEFYPAAAGRPAGRPFGEALLAYTTSSVVGLLHAGGSVTLNPDPTTPIVSGDRILLVSEDDDTAVQEPRGQDGGAVVRALADRGHDHRPGGPGERGVEGRQGLHHVRVAGVLLLRGQDQHGLGRSRTDPGQHGGVGGRTAAADDLRPARGGDARGDLVLHLHLVLGGEDGDGRAALVGVGGDQFRHHRDDLVGPAQDDGVPRLLDGGMTPR
ncbi:CASTOR/POLLUX-related putative ion channel [Streptomyces sp. JL4002]|uniref:CASTOR/POLLUX-related putative ion channel n=1 Tax=Streptomyces sp. JL4002 TaxID=3404781 RepID=UPI003B284F8D